MSSRPRTTEVSIAMIILGFVAVFFLTGFIESRRPALPPGFEDEDLGLEGSRLKGYVFGAEGLMSDWYWMNSLQYLGKKISAVGLENLNLDDMRSLNPRLLYPYLNNAADLDPRFMAPYSYGATILPAIDSDQAIALSEKGIANNPDEWRLHQHLGYIHWKRGEYEKASLVYFQGSNIPGAPPFLRMMAGRMKTEGGSRDTAREIYAQILAAAQDDISKQNAELRLMQIDSLDERDVINPALRQFQTRNGRCPSRWSEIIPLLAAAKLASGRGIRIDQSNNIVDPSGVPYRIDSAKCEAAIDNPRSKIPAA